jgi:hypothetical protein
MNAVLNAVLNAALNAVLNAAHLKTAPNIERTPIKRYIE